MGAWGTGLYSDDFALDVKSEFLDAINSGKPYREAFEELKKTYVDNAYNDDPDIPVFWFVCADILWKKGRLDEDIKQTALEYLESETDIARWAEESPSLGRKRKVVLEKLKLKLLSPQPEAKPIRVKKLYECPWNIGDVYAFALTGELAEKTGLAGTYAIFQVAEKMFINTIGTYPIVRVMLTESREKPGLNDFCKDRLLLSRYDKVHVYARVINALNTKNAKNVVFLGNTAIIAKEDDYGIHLENIFDSVNMLGMDNWIDLPDQIIKDHMMMFRAIPQKDCTTDASSNFSSDETKSGVNT